MVDEIKNQRETGNSDKRWASHNGVFFAKEFVLQVYGSLNRNCVVSFHDLRYKHDHDIACGVSVSWLYCVLSRAVL